MGTHVMLERNEEEDGKEEGSSDVDCVVLMMTT